MINLLKETGLGLSRSESEYLLKLCKDLDVFLIEGSCDEKNTDVLDFAKRLGIQFKIVTKEEFESHTPSKENEDPLK